MKIIFCLRNFLPRHAGGTEVYVAALCAGLQKQGVETIIVKPGFDIAATTEYFYENIRVIEYPETSQYTRDVIIGNTLPGGLPFFEKILLKEKPDVIHFHEVSGSNGITIAHVRIAKELKIPLFITLHLAGYVCKTGTLKYKNKTDCNGFIDDYKCSVCVLHEMGLRYGLPELVTGLGMIAKKLKLPVTKLPGKMESALSYPAFIRKHRTVLEDIFYLSEKVFVLSNWFKKVLLINNMPEDKMILLDKALPHSTLFDERISVGENKSELIPLKFVYMGRISPVKGLHILLKALDKIDMRNWSLDIYGYVEEEGYLAKCKLISNKISSSIHWKGMIEPSQVISTLQQYDALIFPSIIEEMVGLVVMEAFAAGIPVIGSDVKGIAEQITDGETGLLFETGNVKALGEILKEVLDNPAKLKSLSGNIIMPKKFDEIAIYSLTVYKEALDKKTVDIR